MTNRAPAQRSQARILVVTSDRRLIRAVEEGADPGCRIELVAQPRRAVGLLGERAFAGAVIDADTAASYLLALCNGYLARQPIGRAVIVTDGDDPATLMRLAVRDPRLEVLFRPVGAPALREALFGSAAAECEADCDGDRTMHLFLAKV